MTSTSPPRRASLGDLDRARRGRKLDKPRPRGVLPYLPAEVDLLPLWVTAAFRPPKGFEFEAFDRSSARRGDPCSITFRNGRERRTFRFERQADLHSPALRASVAGVSAGWLDMPHLTGSEIEDVWVALCKVARVMSEWDDRDTAVKWMHQLIDETALLTGRTLAGDGRHDGLMAMRNQGEFVRRDAEQLVKGGDGWQRRPVRFVDDQTSEQFVRAGETATFVWHTIGVRQLTRPGLAARLAEIGVENRRYEDRRPPHPKLSLFRLTEDLVEYAGPVPPTSPPPVAQGRLIDSERGSR
jgi:hypothetical protein